MSCDIVFVSMPVVDLQRPNLGLSLLKASLKRAGHSVSVRYPVFSFAERVGLRRYLALSSGTRTWRTLLLGELVFASTAFPEARCRIREAAAWIAEGDPEAAAAQERHLRDLARHARELVFDTAADIVAMRPRIVGCSSTFQQHVASLALLRRIRELDPGIVTMMGGANCETEMGEATHRLFPWVDHVFSGEADTLIEPLCSAIIRQETFTHPAIRSPVDRQLRVGRPDAQPLGRGTVARLDTLPPPDFDDYFDALHASCLCPAIDVGLPVETSRGCWWGAKHHCTFCGLNGGGMAFRSKSPENALDEMLDLSKRYGITNLEVVDNILDMRYIGPVTDALAAAAPPLNIFYEVKSNLTPAQVSACARAGVRTMQPGIESLDTRVLGLMNKGAKAWQQVLFLKEARQHGIQVSWNMLYGFPGESDDWYHELAAFLPLLAHLEPPSCATYIRIDRYSPYFDRAREYGLTLRVHPMMTQVYPVGERDAAALSYHFEWEGQEDSALRPGVVAMSRAVMLWREAFFGDSHPELRVRREGETVVIDDTRPCAQRRRRVLEGVDARVYLACADAPTTKGLRERVGEAVEASLSQFQEDGLLLNLDGRHIALAVEAEAPSYPYFLPFPGGAVNPQRLDPQALRPRGAFERLFVFGESL